jgi:uncharacterized protein
VSIARRLQDPLAELVKIDPKSIGVGQYQHDVSQTRLAKALNAVVEDCVNAVGVDVNTASAPLLTRVSGLSPTLAANIVAHRDQHGAFRNRQALRAVPRLGEKTFELAAGFLRINDSDNPLDRSAVHPEAYPLVERILADIKKGIRDLIGDSRLLKALLPEKYTDEKFGLPTVRDILKELEKPGRDPRPEFKHRRLSRRRRDVKDLQPGMILEGVVTNVANFGAFVDIGVHQDGLVHISAIADRSSRIRAASSRPATWSRSRCSRSTCRASASRSACDSPTTCRTLRKWPGYPLRPGPRQRQQSQPEADRRHGQRLRPPEALRASRRVQ